MTGRTKDLGRAVTLLAFFTWGLTMLARTSFGYYLDELGLSATQAGVANFLTSFCICFSAIAVSRLAERKNAFLPVLAVELAVSAAAIALLSFARSFAAILIAKALLGVGCGPVFTLLMTLVERAGKPEAYATDAGIVACGESILSTMAGPVIIVFLIGRFGMRLANGLLAAVIALLAAAWLLNRKKIAAVGSPQIKGRAKGSVRSLLRNRNIIVCILGGIFSLIACWCIYVYAPTLLKATERYTDSTMSFIMTAMGVFMTAWMLFLPYIGGRIGYKPVAIVFSACGAGSLLALFLKADSLFCVTCFILFGGCCSVISMIYMAIITVDSTEAEQSAAAVALVNALGELLGASVGPLLAGMLSDAYGMKYGMLFAGGSMAIVTAVGFFLKKTEKIQ